MIFITDTHVTHNGIDITIVIVDSHRHTWDGYLFTFTNIYIMLGFCLYPINLGRFSSQYRTDADRCTPTLPR